MSDDRTKSAIDAIYEMLEVINNLNIKVDNIDANIKLLNNKVNKLSEAQVVKKQPPRASPGASDKSSSAMKNVVTTSSSSTTQSNSLVIGKIRAFGYIMNKQQRPIDGVAVQIYNDKNESIRNIKTDKDGYWEARLPKGKYGVEYTHSKFKPINIVINLEDSMKEYEVKR